MEVNERGWAGVKASGSWVLDCISMECNNVVGVLLTRRIMFVIVYGFLGGFLDAHFRLT